MFLALLDQNRSRNICAVVLQMFLFSVLRVTTSLVPAAGVQPEFSFCDCALTVVHVLLECHHCNIENYNGKVSLSCKELFDMVNAHNILAFIKLIYFYSCI